MAELTTDNQPLELLSRNFKLRSGMGLEPMTVRLVI